jgi:hypothetical protein
VSAADEIEPHLSQRRTVYLLPTVHPSNGPRAEFIVMDASIPGRPVQPGTLRATYLWAIDHGYGIRAAQEGLLVLQRGLPQRSLPRRFYSFMFAAGSHIEPVRARSGPLALTGVTVHPGYGWVNAARPAIEIETYWRAEGSPSARARVEFALTPVYGGTQRPAAPPSAAFVGDTPTVDWLPMNRWPRGRTVRVASLPLLPSLLHRGSVDVYLRVTCGAAVGGSGNCAGAMPPRRVATVSVLSPG